VGIDEQGQGSGIGFNVFEGADFLEAREQGGGGCGADVEDVAVGSEGSECCGIPPC
jgi:hypothetical protein